MAEGYKAWNSGDILNAADLNDYASSQAVMRFANAAARDAALTSLVVKEGMVAYLKDSNILTVNTDGTTSGWREVSPAEAASIKDSAVTSAKIQDGAVIASKIPDGTITSAKILDGTIVNADLSASAAIDLTKLASPAWTSYTATISHGTGSPTKTGYSYKIGRLVVVKLQSLTLGAGRSAGVVTCTLPVTAVSANGLAVGSATWLNGSSFLTQPLVATLATGTTIEFFDCAAPGSAYAPGASTLDELNFTVTYESTT
jgi:hypothetical protein